MGPQDFLLQKTGVHEDAVKINNCATCGLLLSVMDANPTQIQAIEKLQKDFLFKIPAIKDLNYWNQLKRLKMLSLQRRLERYRIICTWKILDGLVPNCGIEVKNEGARSV